MKKIIFLTLFCIFSLVKSQNLVFDKLKSVFDSPLKERYLNYIIKEDIKKDSIYDFLNIKKIFDEKDKQYYFQEVKKLDDFFDRFMDADGIFLKKSNRNFSTSDSLDLIYDLYRGSYNGIFSLDAREISANFSKNLRFHGGDIAYADEREHKKNFTYSSEYLFDAFTLSKAEIYNNYYITTNIRCKEKVYAYGSLELSKSHIYMIEYFFTTDISNVVSEKDNDKYFQIHLFENIGSNLKENPYLKMRKLEITGNKEEAIKYLLKNKLDYDEIKPENYKEEDFKKKDKILASASVSPMSINKQSSDNPSLLFHLAP